MRTLDATQVSTERVLPYSQCSSKDFNHGTIKHLGLSDWQQEGRVGNRQHSEPEQHAEQEGILGGHLSAQVESGAPVFFPPLCLVGELPLASAIRRRLIFSEIITETLSHPATISSLDRSLHRHCLWSLQLSTAWGTSTLCYRLHHLESPTVSRKVHSYSVLLVNEEGNVSQLRDLLCSRKRLASFLFSSPQSGYL